MTSSGMMFIESFFEINNSVQKLKRDKRGPLIHARTYTQHGILMIPFFLVKQISPNVFL